MQRIPAHVSLRALRQMHGLTAKQFADRLADRGVTVDLHYIYSVELGHRKPSNAVRNAWADEVGISPRDIKFEADLRDMIAETDAENESTGRAA